MHMYITNSNLTSAGLLRCPSAWQGGRHFQCPRDYAWEMTQRQGLEVSTLKQTISSDEQIFSSQQEQIEALYVLPNVFSHFYNTYLFHKLIREN